MKNYCHFSKLNYFISIKSKPRLNILQDKTYEKRAALIYILLLLVFLFDIMSS